jgi:hypothetical protein
LTGLDWFVLQIKTKIVGCHTADSKSVKQGVNITVNFPLLVFPGLAYKSESKLTPKFISGLILLIFGGNLLNSF